MKNHANSIKYQEHLKEYDIFTDEYLESQEEIKLTPSIELQIKTYHYSGKITDNYFVSIHNQEVVLFVNKEQIFEYKFIWGNLFYHYFKNSDGEEYLICGHDITYYTLFNITKRKSYSFLDKSVIDENAENPSEFLVVYNAKYITKSNLLMFEGIDWFKKEVTATAKFSIDNFPFKFEFSE